MCDVVNEVSETGKIIAVNNFSGFKVNDKDKTIRRRTSLAKGMQKVALGFRKMKPNVLRLSSELQSAVECVSTRERLTYCSECLE